MLTQPPYRYVIGASLLLVQFTLGLNFLGVPPLFPLAMEELGIDRATVSLLFSVVPIANGAFALFAGVIAARAGIARTFAIGCVAMAAGLSAPLLMNLPALLGARLVFGMGTGLVAPLTSAIVAQWFRGKELPLLNGLTLVAASSGVTFGLFAAVPLSGVLGWRGTLAVFGAMAGVAALAWIVFGREEQGHAQRASKAETAAQQSSVLKNPATYWLAIAFSAPITFNVVLMNWLPSYYHEVFKMDLAQAAALTGIVGFMGVPGSLGSSLLSARIGLRRPFLIIPGLILGPAGMVAILFEQTWIILPALILYGFFNGVFSPIVFTIPMELPGYRPAHVATTAGVILAITGVATSFAPSFAGALTDTTGSYLPGFALFMATSGLLFLAGLNLPETGPRGQRPAPIIVPTPAESSNM